MRIRRRTLMFSDERREGTERMHRPILLTLRAQS